MQLTVLAVPGCPSAPVLSDRLAAVVDGRAGVSASHRVISDEGEAARAISVRAIRPGNQEFEVRGYFRPDRRLR